MDEKKVREAIEYFSKYIYVHDSLPEPFMWKGKEECETAIEALEKQLAKKPNIYREFKDEIDFDCPECERSYLMSKSDAMLCCPYCGCVFEWPE